MKKAGILLAMLIIGHEGYSCTTCNPQVQEKIYNSTFFPNLLTMLSPFIVLTVLVGILAFLSTKKYKTNIAAGSGDKISNPIPLTASAMVLGIGIGGFIDGIALHQILQWHEMLSNKIPPITVESKSVNMFWDGIFHAFTLAVVVTGVVLLWRLLPRKDIDRSGKIFIGGLLSGWGLFNIVEGIINHHLLKLHNVREIIYNVDTWNFSFLGLSGVILIVGFALIGQRLIAKRTFKS